MATATKTRTPMGPGEMKNLANIASGSVPTMISKTLAEKLARKNNLSGRLKKFWDEILKEDGVESFIVGEVFQHRNADCIPQYFGDQYRDWLWIPEKDKEIIIDTEAVRKLKEYRLPKNMNDTTIQKNTGSTPISPEEYWLVRYLLIVNPELGKQVLGYEVNRNSVYIMHVQLIDGSVVAVYLYWSDAGWSSRAGRFAGDRVWREGYVFLSFATAA